MISTTELRGNRRMYDIVSRSLSDDLAAARARPDAIAYGTGDIGVPETALAGRAATDAAHSAHPAAGGGHAGGHH